MGSEHGGSKRRTITVTDNSSKRLECIKANTEISTDSGAIRAALKLYHELMSDQMEGCDVVVKRNGDVTHTVPKLFDEYVAPVRTVGSAAPGSVMGRLG